MSEVRRIAERILAARDGDEDARDTVLEDAFALAERTMAFLTGGTVPADYPAEPDERKAHVLVPQDKYLTLLEGRRFITVARAAEVLDVSEATARRQLDGLVAQGRLVWTDPGGPGRIPERVRYSRSEPA